jgi:hypothetical protein
MERGLVPLKITIEIVLFNKIFSKISFGIFGAFLNTAADFKRLALASKEQPCGT